MSSLINFASHFEKVGVAPLGPAQYMLRRAPISLQVEPAIHYLGFELLSIVFV